MILMTCAAPVTSFNLFLDIRNGLNTLMVLHIIKKWKKHEQHRIIGQFEGNDMEYLYKCHSMCAGKVQMFTDSNLGVRAMIRTMVYQ